MHPEGHLRLQMQLFTHACFSSVRNQMIEPTTQFSI
jgi:hypothetical protein